MRNSVERLLGNSHNKVASVINWPKPVVTREYTDGWVEVISALFLASGIAGENDQILCGHRSDRTCSRSD